MVQRRLERCWRAAWSLALACSLGLGAHAQGPAGGDVKTVVRLDEVEDGATPWHFDNGQEFKGAKGSLQLLKDEPAKGQTAFKLTGDFTGGGAYVQMLRDLKGVEMKDLAALRCKVKSDNVKTLSVRLLDATGQCHQRKGLRIEPDGQWHELELIPTKVVGQEHWSGANDGKWHGPATLVAFILGNDKGAPDKTPAITFGDQVAETWQAGVVQAATFNADFEGGAALPAGWTSQGRATLDTQVKFAGAQALALVQPTADVEKPLSITSAPFAVTPGIWEVKAAISSDLVSPDASFNGVVTLQWLKAGGQRLDSLILAEVFGKTGWQLVSKRVEPPAGATQAQFHAQVNKATGTLWLDQLSAAFVTVAPKKDSRVDRILFATGAVGSLWLPDDKRSVKVSVVATRPLDEAQLSLGWSLRDYWGAECAPAGSVPLAKPRREGKNYVYDATVDLGGDLLALGRYYELHGFVARAGDEPFHNHISLAVLPPAVTKAYKPEQIPFTSRSWDNRLGDYFHLSDRLGVRICGIWGGWDSKPPYKPDAPSIELCDKLGMGVLTGTPAHSIEHHNGGWEKYDETALRQGVRNWLAKYGQRKPLIVDLGNEPPGNPERVKPNIAAYKAIYEEVKAIDPSVTVLASSMGPSEQYFQNGFQQYCDAYDFHVYEDWASLGQVFDKYKELIAKYGGEKPIWSTELGLNSQGMARHAVAVEVIKKLTMFFAHGGANVSWFGIMYPDGDGKSAGSAGEAHNLFDCRYNRYCPKLDAVAYYNMVNGICIKRFVARRTYANGVSAFLFRDTDQRCLQVLWKDKGRADVQVPLPGAQAVTLIATDGRRTDLNAGGTGLTLSVTEDPSLLLYEHGAAQLAEQLVAPSARLEAVPSGIVKGTTATLAVSGDPDAELSGPATWTVQRSAEAGRVSFAVQVPDGTSAREGDFVVKLKGGTGQLHARLPVTSRVSIRLLPVPATTGKPGVRLLVHNYAAAPERVGWRLSLGSQLGIAAGRFEVAPTAAQAYFTDAAEGTALIPPQGDTEVVVPLAGVERQTVYTVKALVTDSAGRSVVAERPMAGFVGVPKLKAPLTLDGDLDKPAWRQATPLAVDQARQYFSYDAARAKWKGAEDLSATVKFLWDDQYLYIGVKATDDVFANNKRDADIWAGDGLQFIVDPAREAAEKPGKYDLATALTKQGPQSWCFLSADPRSPAGEVKEIKLATRRLSADRGDMTYEVAIPWFRLAPFTPKLGANLGLCVTLNEDDGPGRLAFMTWFGDVQAKRVDTVGDLVLGE